MVVAYNGKLYPIRVFLVEEIAGEVVIAPEMLFLDMVANLPLERWNEDCEENIIDSEITYFVDDACMSYTAGKICMDCMPTPLTLIEELSFDKIS